MSVFPIGSNSDQIPSELFARLKKISLKYIWRFKGTRKTKMLLNSNNKRKRNQ